MQFFIKQIIMDKCRICLKNRAKLGSIFDTHEDNTLAFMMTSLTKIKIGHHDEANGKICSLCRKNLIEAFNFKVLIESSDEILHNTANNTKIYFNNLQDIKKKIEIDDDNVNDMKHTTNLDDYFKDGEISFTYNNTLIKKIKPCEIKTESSLSLVDFINNFGNNDSEYLYDDTGVDDNYEKKSDDEDEDYRPPLPVRRKKRRMKKYKRVIDHGQFDNDDEDYELSLFVRRKKQRMKKNKRGKDHGQSDNEDKDYELPLSVEKKEQSVKSKRVRRGNTKLTKVLIKPVITKDIEIVHKIEKKHENSKRNYKKYQKLVMCYYCGKMTNNLNRHILVRHTGERSHKCDKCSKAFFTDKDLLKHQQAHSEKTFKCANCVAAFTSKQLLQSHMKTHNEERQFKCDICQKSFKRKGALCRHRLIHSIANKTFKCDLCKMSFFNKYNLEHHLRVHTGERPFNCELCSQPYSYKHDFNRHCFNKHGVFLKRRSVYVMNEEVLVRERALMRDLVHRIHGLGKVDGSLNPFKGPQAALAFQHAIKAIETKKIPVDYGY